MKQIPLSVPCLKGNEWKYIKECLDHNWVSSAGKFVDIFEDNVARYVGARYGVATVNGTAAIHIALKVLGIGPGDRVLVPTLTFIATVNPVVYCGAEPVFIDSEEQTYNIDPEKTVNKIREMIKCGEKPRAVIVVHLFGHPADIDPILDICKKNGIYVIEDATEALGSRYKGRMAGSLADIGCFSFNGNKLITTGGGGMLVTDNQYWAERARYLTTQAKDDPVQFIHNEIGYNYRLTNIQAALGVAQLEQIDQFIARKREIAEYYHQAFNKIPGIKVCPEEEWAFSNYWLYSILVDKDEFGVDSKLLCQKLRSEGILVRPFFKPVHQLPAYQNYEADITVAHRLWEQGINLPCSVRITREELDYVIKKVISYRQ